MTNTTERDGASGGGGGGGRGEGEKERVRFCCDRVPYLLIHSTTRNRETLGSCRSRIRESRPIVCSVVSVLYIMYVCVCVYMSASFLCKPIFTYLTRLVRVYVRVRLVFHPLVLFFFRSFRSRGCKP